MALLLGTPGLVAFSMNPGFTSNRFCDFLLFILLCVKLLGGNRPCSFLSWDGIISSTRERIAAKEPPETQCRSVKHAMFGHGFCCVL